MKLATRREVAKWVVIALFTAVVAWWTVFLTGCGSHPVVAKPVESATIAYDGNEQTAGFLGFAPDGSGILTESKKAEYDALVRLYGRGTADYPITSPVLPGVGLSRRTGKELGFPAHGWLWLIDRAHLTYFMTFRDWQRTGRSPR